MVHPPFFKSRLRGIENLGSILLLFIAITVPLLAIRFLEKIIHWHRLVRCLHLSSHHFLYKTSSQKKTPFPGPQLGRFQKIIDRTFEGNCWLKSEKFYHRKICCHH